MGTIDFSGPSAEICYDKETQLYTGTLVSFDGEKTFEGASYSAVANAIIREYNNACDKLLRELEKDRSQAKTSPARTRSISSTNKEAAQEPERGLSTTERLGNFGAAWYKVMDDVFKLCFSKKAYAVHLGGKVLYGRSRKKLRKRLMIERNRRIQRIVQHMKQHKKERDQTLSQNKAKATIGRIKAKKQRAQILARKSWEDRLGKGHKSPDWERRVKRLRTRVKDKKSQARDLWG